MTGRRDRGCCCDSQPSDGSAYCCDLDGDSTYPGCSQEYQLQWGSMQFGLFDFNTSPAGPDCCQGSWSINKGSIALERLNQATCIRMASAGTYVPKQIGSYTECVGTNVLWYRPFSFSGALAYQGNGANCIRSVPNCGKPVPCECSNCTGDGPPIAYGAFGSTEIRMGLVALTCSYPLLGTCNTGKYFTIHFKFWTGICLNGNGASCPSSLTSCTQLPPTWQPVTGGPYATEQFCACSSNNLNTGNYCGCDTYGGEIKFRTPLLQAVPGSGSNRPTQCPGGQTYNVHSWTGGGNASGSIAVIPL